MAKRDQPYLPLYIQDFMTDEKLLECSAESTGVYVRIMCIMHKSETYGKVLLKQKYKQKDKQILNFALMVAKSLPYDLVVIESSLIELIEENVLQIEGDYLVQKRMVRDAEISNSRALSGREGGTKTQNKNKNFALANIKANSENDNEYENKIKEGVVGETIKIDLIQNEKMPIGWADVVSEFINDYDFKKSCCQFYSAEWSEVEDRMVKFIQGVHLKQQFQDIAALKTHFRNHYKKHYINNGSSVKQIKEKNQGALSSGFIEAPKNFDYDKMEKW